MWWYWIRCSTFIRRYTLGSSTTVDLLYLNLARVIMDGGDLKISGNKHYLPTCVFLRAKETVTQVNPSHRVSATCRDKTAHMFRVIFHVIICFISISDCRQNYSQKLCGEFSLLFFLSRLPDVTVALLRHLSLKRRRITTFFLFLKKHL